MSERRGKWDFRMVMTMRRREEKYQGPVKGSTLERHITPKASKERHQVMGVFTKSVEGKRERERIYTRG